MKDFNIKVKFQTIEDKNTHTFVYLNILKDNISKQGLDRNDLEDFKSLLEKVLNEYQFKIEVIFELNLNMNINCLEISKDELNDVNEVIPLISKSFKIGAEILFNNDIIKKEIEMRVKDDIIHTNDKRNLIYMYNILLMKLYDTKDIVYRCLVYKFKDSEGSNCFMYSPFFYKNFYKNMIDDKSTKEELIEMTSRSIYQLLYDHYNFTKKPRK